MRLGFKQRIGLAELTRKSFASSNGNPFALEQRGPQFFGMGMMHVEPQDVINPDLLRELRGRKHLDSISLPQGSNFFFSARCVVRSSST